MAAKFTLDKGEALAPTPKAVAAAIARDKQKASKPAGTSTAQADRVFRALPGMLGRLPGPLGSIVGGAAAAGLDTGISAADISAGQGDVMDYVNVGLAPLALTGFGGAKAVQAGDRALATAMARNALTNPRVSITAPQSVMTDIMSSRFKNQFETSPDNLLSNQKRAQVEQWLGVPENALAYERPIYGAIENKFTLPMPLLSKIPGLTGKTARILDPRTNSSPAFGGDYPAISHVDARNMQGTFTIGDSFAPMSDRVFNLQGDDVNAAASQLVDSLKKRPNEVHYVEAQMRPRIEPFSGRSELGLSVRNVDLPVGGDELYWMSRALADVPAGQPGNWNQLQSAARSKAIQDLINKRTQAWEGELTEAAFRGANVPPSVTSSGKLPTTNAKFRAAANSYDPFVAPESAQRYVEWVKKLRGQ